MLDPKPLAAKPILTEGPRDEDGEMFFIYNDNFNLGDEDELALEDWKLPPSIEEDEEAVLAGRQLDIILDRSKDTRDCPLDSAMASILNYKLTPRQSLWPKLAAPSPPPVTVSSIPVISQRASREYNSYGPSYIFPVQSRPFSVLAAGEWQSQSDVEHPESSINLSLDATTVLFIPLGAIITSLTILRRLSSPNITFSRLFVHHSRQPSFSASPINLAEIGRLRKGFRNAEFPQRSGDISSENGMGEKSIDLDMEKGLVIVLFC